MRVTSVLCIHDVARIMMRQVDVDACMSVCHVLMRATSVYAQGEIQHYTYIVCLYICVCVCVCLCVFVFVCVCLQVM